MDRAFQRIRSLMLRGTFYSVPPIPSCFRSVRTNIHFNIRLPLPNSHQKRGFTNLSSGDVKDNPGTERRISL